jgi:DNA-binding NarL/FixJ family response regulator
MTVRILIVDDSELIRKVLREELRAHTGWEVCGEAGDGRQGVEFAAQLKPDLIVLDLSMPVMNGLEAASILRKSLPSTPIVMFTSYKTDHLAVQALEAGVTMLIQKPDLALLVRTIRSLFPEKSGKLRDVVA